MLNTRSIFRSTSTGVALAFALLVEPSASVADTVFLKGGEKVDGKIIAESESEVTIQYNVSASIKDDRTIKRADIEKIEKDAPDLAAWAALKQFRVAEDGLDPTTYTHYITALKGFLSQYPAATNAGDAKAALETLEAEKKRIDAGEFKFDGKWLAKEELQREKVQVLGNSYLRQMKRLAAAGRVQDVLVTFETMEKAAGGSGAFPEAVEMARRSLVSLKQAADAGVARLKAQALEEKKTLEKLNEPQRSMTAKDLKYLRDQAEAQVTTLERSGVKWMPITPGTERSLVALASKAGTEIVRLNGLPTENMRASLKEVEKAKAAIAAGDLATADAAYAKAGQLWSANEQVQRGLASVAALRKSEADKMAAEKQAAELAAKKAKEADEAAKKAAALAALKPAPTPEPTPVVAEPEEPKKEPSFFSKPAGWVILAVLLAFGGIIAKAIRKHRDPSNNILDQ
jgi:hypothetical protein